MAENCVKMKNRKQIGKTRKLVRFSGPRRAATLERDIVLTQVVERVRSGQELWRRLCGDSDDDQNDFHDFDGFDAFDCSPKESTSGTTTHTTDDVRDDAQHDVRDDTRDDAPHLDTNHIQRLLRNRWEQRIRQLVAEKQKPELKSPILRKARLQVNPQTIARIRSRMTAESSVNRTNPRPTLAKSGQPGVITCAICTQTKFYAHVQRRYGVFSCEPCSKFFARFLRQPKQFFCSQNGDCLLEESSSKRCKGCWLSQCFQKFKVEQSVRQSVCSEFAPKLVSPPNVALITVDTQSTQSSETIQNNKTNDNHLLMVARPQRPSGPRVKRVCRSAGTASGLRRATFAESDDQTVDVFLFSTHALSSQECDGCRSEDCVKDNKKLSSVPKSSGRRFRPNNSNQRFPLSVS
ncbi:uncharacterized protein LOC128965718 [Oppia nitens]|uniref:uncharacterized protein LOC128965718 n=1 Tax=Oppia nitens TaxID=1686743 RepID=UPI0023DC94F3|nr:uncharacterized protein LOC128965718 [Oppia nitens]